MTASNVDQRPARPFLRWAGSKQKLLSVLLPLVPKQFGHYYEPFLGAGALFFGLSPTHATLSDTSRELIDTWKAVRDHPNYLCDYLAPLRPSKELFYRIRDNRSTNFPARAGEFLYLNKTCWNGLYRVNSKGDFNVPFGAPKTDFIFDRGNLLACAKILSKSGITIISADFHKIACKASRGDFVFLDPPYVTKHNHNGFRDWNENLFKWEDQVRLANLANRLADRGVHVLISNADHPSIRKLYKNFSFSCIERSSTLASNRHKRGRITEAIFHTS